MHQMDGQNLTARERLEKLCHLVRTQRADIEARFWADRNSSVLFE